MGSRSQAASSTRLSAHYTRATSRLEALAVATLMGVAMLVLFSVEQRFELHSNFPGSCIVELTLHWANGRMCATARDFNWSHDARNQAGQACVVIRGVVSPRAALDIHLELQAP